MAYALDVAVWWAIHLSRPWRLHIEKRKEKKTDADIRGRGTQKTRRRLALFFFSFFFSFTQGMEEIIQNNRSGSVRREKNKNRLPWSHQACREPLGICDAYFLQTLSYHRNVSSNSKCGRIVIQNRHSVNEQSLVIDRQEEQKWLPNFAWCKRENKETSYPTAEDRATESES